MTIIPIAGLHQLPPQYAYHGYQGAATDCVREFQARFPWYDCGVAFYYEARQVMFVPMNWTATAEKSAVIEG